MVRVVFVGAGGWISDYRLGYTSIALESGDGSLMLIDAGEGVYSSMLRCGLDPLKVEALLITHRHGDHILGLPTIALMHRRSGRRLTVLGLRETLDAVAKLLDISGVPNWLTALNFVELRDGDEFSAGSFKVKAVKANHTVPAMSVRVEVDGKCVAYSGDTRYNNRFVEAIKGCDVLIHEASSYREETRVHGHSTYMDAVRVASEARVRTLVFIHFYEKPLEIRLDMFSGEYPKNIYVAYPCMELFI